MTLHETMYQTVLFPYSPKTWFTPLTQFYLACVVCTTDIYMDPIIDLCVSLMTWLTYTVD
jgi:hypothetical protein